MPVHPRDVCTCGHTAHYHTVEDDFTNPCGIPSCVCKQFSKVDLDDPEGCTHNFTFLRRDKTNIGYDRNPTWLEEDVFFCSHCLEYKRVKVEEWQPSSQSFYERIVTKRY